MCINGFWDEASHARLSGSCTILCVVSADAMYAGVRLSVTSWCCCTSSQLEYSCSSVLSVEMHWMAVCSLDHRIFPSSVPDNHFSRLACRVVTLDGKGRLPRHWRRKQWLHLTRFLRIFSNRILVVGIQLLIVVHSDAPLKIFFQDFMYFRLYWWHYSDIN